VCTRFPFREHPLVEGARAAVVIPPLSPDPPGELGVVETEGPRLPSAAPEVPEQTPNRPTAGRQPIQSDLGSRIRVGETARPSSTSPFLLREVGFAKQMAPHEPTRQPFIAAFGQTTTPFVRRTLTRIESVDHRRALS